MFSEQFKKRLQFGGLGFFLILISIFFSHHSFFRPIFIAFTAIIMGFSLHEYYHLAEQKGWQPFKWFGIGSSILYLTVIGLSTYFPHLESLPNFVLLGSFILLFILFFYENTFPVVNSAVTIFGIVYLTIPLSNVIRINYFPFLDSIQDGRFWLAYVLIISKLTDIGGYFIGKWKGKHLLAPSISPQKTIEGAIGGLVISLFASLIFSLFSCPYTFSLTIWQSIWMGITISLLAQLGDLTESILKRDAKVKDSSHLPGLGGILDTVDSLVFTLPFMYLLLQIRILSYT